MYKTRGYAAVAELADAADLKSVHYGFKSHSRYHKQKGVSDIKKFNPEDYDLQTVMICESYDEASEFTELLHSFGKKWHGGASYLETINYDHNKEGYRFNNPSGGLHDRAEYYEDNEERYNILYWRDFRGDSLPDKIEYDITSFL